MSISNNLKPLLSLFKETIVAMDEKYLAAMSLFAIGFIGFLHYTIYQKDETIEKLNFRMYEVKESFDSTQTADLILFNKVISECQKERDSMKYALKYRSKK